MKEDEDLDRPITAAELFVRKWQRLTPKQVRKFEQLMAKHIGKDWRFTCNVQEQLYLVNSVLSGLEPSPLTLRGIKIDGRDQSPVRYPPADGWRP